MSRLNRCKASWICRPAVLRVRPIHDADHSLRLAQESNSAKFLPASAPAKGQGRRQGRHVQNGGLAAGGKKVFFKLLRLGKLDKLLIHQIVKGNLPFPPPAQLQNFIYGGSDE